MCSSDLYILEGNRQMLQPNYSNAISTFGRAVSLDPVFCYNAYYNRAYCRINDGGKDAKAKTADDLSRCADILQEVILPSYMQIYNCIENKELNPPEGSGSVRLGLVSKFSSKAEDGQGQDTPFTTQIMNRLNFLYIQLHSISEAHKKMNEHKDVIAKFVPIEEYYRDNNKEDPVPDHIDGFRENGFVGFVKIEKKPVPWWAIFTVFLLGALQTIAGAALIVFSVGSLTSVGTGILSEGISDIALGIQAAVTGEFSWSEYLQGKAISLGISLVLGFAGAAVKAIAKVATAAIKYATKAIGTIATKAASTTLGKIVMKGVGYIGRFEIGRAHV